MSLGKKGQIENIQALIIPLVGIAVVLAIGFLILAEVQTQQFTKESGVGSGNCSSTTYDNCSVGYNATATTMQAMDDIPGWLPIIVVTVIGAILIGLVSMYRSRR